MNTQNTVSTTITSASSLMELLAVIGEVGQAERKPGAIALQENEKLIAESDDGTVKAYGNGYAVYQNDSGRTVVFIPDCKNYTYDFDHHCDSEIKDSETEDVSGLSWIIAIALRGESQIEYHTFGYSDDRKDGKSENDADSCNKKEDQDDRGARPAHFPSPEGQYLFKEEVLTRLKRLTNRERETIIWTHTYGYTQQEIADYYGVSRISLRETLKRAEDKFGGEKAAELLLSKVA